MCCVAAMMIRLADGRIDGEVACVYLLQTHTLIELRQGLGFATGSDQDETRGRRSKLLEVRSNMSCY